MTITFFIPESLRTELEHKHSLELEQSGRQHQQQMHAARMELERALEITRQKVHSHSIGGSSHRPSKTSMKP